ncbi:ribonuclease HII [Roseicyclus sp. F158]|uniref:Ribonuclease HII n=1 Tax=Tropicimonas omnivorans TaxID=3075590 RepID=A0ABU3DC01_9RHOB|nr:ribonuclease HII [Roseicyclus sp. F158]MDT0681242.1 ribonuclease HII [Roseicyclus sp. F158]
MSDAPSLPDLSFERDAIALGARLVAGVDEVGRGPLAGPVTAAAVVLDPDRLPEGLNDSKKLTAARREALAGAIHDCASVAIVHVEVDEIDRINILRAAQLAMRLALCQLAPAPCHALIDGNLLPADLPCPARAVVKGDALSASIAAASIVAKVARDRLMVDLAQQHPGYGWETNAGYGTKCHLDALRNLGPTPFHRRSFRPVRDILCQAESLRV